MARTSTRDERLQILRGGAAKAPGLSAAVSRLGRGWRPDFLSWAILASLLVHGALLTVQLGVPQALNRLIEDSPLDVILVNARSEQAPDKAQARAQANLVGGGEAEAGWATANGPVSPDAPDNSLEAVQARVKRMEREQQALLATLSKDAAFAAPSPDARAAADRSNPGPEDRQASLSKRLAEIQQRIQTENARPRKRFVSPSTQEAVYALYYDTLRRRIEDVGTKDFPEAEGQKLYGELTMNIMIDAAGHLLDAVIAQPSQSKLLDQRALAIVRRASPFGPFTRAMQREADQIVVTSRFRFTKDEGITASVGSKAVR